MKGSTHGASFPLAPCGELVGMGLSLFLRNFIVRA